MSSNQIKKTSFEERLESSFSLIPEDDLKKLAKTFQLELIAALHNQQSSLPTILNPIYKMKPKQGAGVAISIGGTNGYVSAFKVTAKGVIQFINRIVFSIPPKIAKNELFQLIATKIIEASKGKKDNFTIGVGLAYPLKPILLNGLLDGELMQMTKEREIKGLVGKKVGMEFQKFLNKEFNIDTKVTVANDAICLLLGGIGAEVTGVVGTGVNFAYWEKRSNIAPLKLNSLSGFGQNEVAVNIEARNFDKISGTKYRDAIDNKSDDPGYSLAEKEAAGAYLYKIFNAGINKILGEDFPKLDSTDQLNEIMTGAFEYPKKITDDKKLIIKKFVERIFHRSAQVVAIELCGILMKIKKTIGIVPIVMDGGLFWKAKNYPSLVNLYINKILPEVIPSFTRLFGSSRKGIAILASSV